jgi:hypothetical protein
MIMIWLTTVSSASPCRSTGAHPAEGTPCIVRSSRRGRQPVRPAPGSLSEDFLEGERSLQKKTKTSRTDEKSRKTKSQQRRLEP